MRQEYVHLYRNHTYEHEADFVIQSSGRDGVKNVTQGAMVGH